MNFASSTGIEFKASGDNVLSVPLSILLVEDDEDDYLLAKELLQNMAGYEVVLEWESNHRSGLKRFKEGNFDVCLVDFQIGAETGIDFISEAKLHEPDIPLILTTGVSDRTIDLEASQAGAAGFFDKASLTSDSLERAIRYALVQLQQTRLRRVHAEMERSNIESELREAIRQRQFEVYLQPQVHCESLQITKAEALIRWNHPTRGLVPPSAFIEIAEKSQLIIGMSKFLIEEVCNFSNRLNAISSNIKIALNVSVTQLERHDFAETLEEALAANRTDPASIELEITESVAMREPRLVSAHMNALKKYGITFAIDDFGTGYSGLATVKEFPFDTIKIDKAFVQTAEHRARDRAIAKTMFYLADILRLETVAEGVETDTQFNFAKNFGATFAQGYLFSKPVKFDDFQSYVAQFNRENGPETTSGPVLAPARKIA